MKDWQIDAIEVVKSGRDDFIAHINHRANTYIDDIINGDEGYKDIEPDSVMEWLWESA